MIKINYPGLEWKGQKWVPSKERKIWDARKTAWGSPRNPQELKVRTLYMAGKTRSSRDYKLENRERVKEEWAAYKRAAKSQIESYWSEFKKEKTSAQSEYATYRQQVYSQIPNLRVTKIPGQRGYAPISGIAGRNIRREQSRRKRIRAEALKPVREAEQAMAKSERDIRNQAKQFGAQLN